MFDRSFLCACVGVCVCAFLLIEYHWLRTHDDDNMMLVQFKQLMTCYCPSTVSVFSFLQLLLSSHLTQLRSILFYLFHFIFCSWCGWVKVKEILRRGQMNMRALHLLIFTWLLLHYAHVVANGLLLHNIGMYKMITHCACVPVEGEEMHACTHARTHIQ